MARHHKTGGCYGIFTFETFAHAQQHFRAKGFVHGLEGKVDEPQFGDQVFQIPPVGFGRVGVFIFRKGYHRLFFAPRGGEHPVGKNALRVDQVLQRVFDGPFAGRINPVAQGLPCIDGETVDFIQAGLNGIQQFDIVGHKDVAVEVFW